MHAKLRIGNASRRGTRPGDQWAANVTNVVKPTRFQSPRESPCYKHRQSTPKTAIFSEKALGLTTFVTTRTRAPQKLNTRDPHDTHRKRRARLRFPWAVAGPGRASRRKAWPRCRWVAAGPGRASRSTTPSAARVWRSRGRAAAHRHTQRPGPTKQPGPTRRPEHPWRHKQHHHSGGPPPTGTHSGRALRRPEHQGYRTFRVAGVSPRCCGRGWRGGVRSSKLRRPSRG